MVIHLFDLQMFLPCLCYHTLEKSAEKSLLKQLKAGKLSFTLHGKKLKGEFALVKLKGKQENAWLLIKHKDEYAVATKYDSEKETAASSPINKWLAENRTTKTSTRSKKKIST